MIVDILPARSGHHGIDSAIDIARAAGGGPGVVVGHIDYWGSGYGERELVVAAQMPDDSWAIVAELCWRWSPSGERWVYGWWYGDGEWDVSRILRYGPVLDGVET